MRRVSWDRLADPFPAEAVRWHAEERDPDAGRVRMVPHVAAAAVRERLDQVAGPDGWSFRVRAWGDGGLIAELSVADVVRAAALATVPTVVYRAAGPAAPDAEPLVAGGAGTAPTEVALAAAAAGFGAIPLGAPDDGVRIEDDGWVEAAPSDGPEDAASRPLHLPAVRRGDPPPSEPAADGGDEAERVIVRLVERLREEGLGAEAAKRVTAHGGYGRTPEAKRELYTELRTLLKERTVAG